MYIKKVVAKKAADVTPNDTDKTFCKSEESEANTKGVNVEKQIIKGIQKVGDIAGSGIDATTDAANLGGQVAGKTTEV